MKITDVIVKSVVAEKQRTQAQRSAEKCWPGKHKEGTKPSPTHPGIRVNNCVPNESIEEGTPDDVTWMRSLRPMALRAVQNAGLGKLINAPGPEGITVHTSKGTRGVSVKIKSYGDTFKKHNQKIIDQLNTDFPNAKIWFKNPTSIHEQPTIYVRMEYDAAQGMMEEETEAWDKPGYDLIVMDYYNSGNTPSEIAQQLGIDEEEVEYIIYKHENGLAEAGSPAQQAAIAINMKKHHQKPKHTDEDAEAQFDRIEEMVEQLAEQYGVDSEAVWDLLEDHTDEDLLTETAAWHRKAGKNKNGGLNRKGVMSYRREHPGSKLQTAVTTKPSKLKPGSKAAKRRKSFCARMSGVKGPMKKPNGKPTRKALALRKWNC